MTASTEKLSTILVIVGITGDLSKRKLLPAIERLAAANVLPAHFKILGITRRDVSAHQVVQAMPADTPHGFINQSLEMFQMDLADGQDYKRLIERLDGMARGMDGPVQRLFYLSVPPQISLPVVKLLGAAGLSDEPHTKLLLEKPFGVDLASATELIDQTKEHFKESQVYRIDHYLAKDMAQNLIVFREGNALFRHTWNKDFIEKIDIVASEKIGIEGRAAFYEQTGALRDLVQSHLLQLTALTLMHPPESHDLRNICQCRIEALRQLHVPADQAPALWLSRGQYQGYRDEVKNPGSMVETFVDLTLMSDDPAWGGVPIHIVTGKHLKEKATEIRITYKKTEQYESNSLVIRFQPNEGIELKLWTKVPDYEWRVENHSLGLNFQEKFANAPEAYEQVLLDALKSDQTLFTTSDEVLESWRILAPVQRHWEMNSEDLILYKPGSTTTEVIAR
jgi:glucose-6-phosphate 1-dehydrogenase